MKLSFWLSAIVLGVAVAQLTTIQQTATITASPIALPTTGVPQALIGSSYISDLGACKFESIT
jgi:hypothetical protein